MRQHHQKIQGACGKGERGAVLAYTVISVLFLFFAVGLGVDLGHLYLVKTESQNAADSAALAGASALLLPNDQKITTAVDRALDVLNQNKYNFNNRNYEDVMPREEQADLIEFSVNLDGEYVDVETATANPDDIRFIRVTTPDAPVTVFFAAPLLGSTQEISAKATAGMSVPGNLRVCIAPLTAVACPPNSPNCTLCGEREEGYPNCTASKYWGKCPGADPYAIQNVPRGEADDPDKNGLCDPKKEFCRRCTYNIRAEGAGGGGPSPGNFQILRCAGNGANPVRQSLAEYGTNCQCGLVGPDDEIETQTGVDAGAVRTGLNVRFDDYGGGLSYSTNMPPDSNIAQGTPTGNGANRVWPGISYGQYTGNLYPGESPVTPVGPGVGHTGVPNRRRLILPITPITEFDNGNDTVTPQALGVFFMRSQISLGTGGDIQVEFVPEPVSSIVGFDPFDDSTTNIVTPVLYR